MSDVVAIMIIIIYIAMHGVSCGGHYSVAGFPRITKSIKLISYLKIDAVTPFC